MNRRRARSERRQQERDKDLARLEIVLPLHVDFRRDEEFIERQPTNFAVRVDELDAARRARPAQSRASTDGRRRRLHWRRWRGTGSRRGWRSSDRRPCAGSDARRSGNTSSADVASRLPPRVAMCADLRARRSRRGARPAPRSVGARSGAPPPARASPSRRCAIRRRLVLGDGVEARHAAQIDQTARREQAFLHQVEQIDAARLQDDRQPARRRWRARRPWPQRSSPTPPSGLGDAASGHPFEAVHGHQASPPTPARTTARFIGKARSRTPIAL